MDRLELILKYNNLADGKTSEETQMIINHKNAIKYIIYNKKEIDLKKIFSINKE